MAAADLDPCAVLCCCGARGCDRPGHVPAGMEFIPFHRRPRRKVRRRRR